MPWRPKFASDRRGTPAKTDELRCPCNWIERQPSFWRGAPPALEPSDPARWIRPPRWGMGKVRCRDHGLVLEVAAYDYMNKEILDYRLADEGVERYLELLACGELEGSPEFRDDVKSRRPVQEGPARLMYLTPRQAAAYIGESEAAVRTLCSQKHLAHRPFGGEPRIQRLHLDAYLRGKKRR